jgi:hypothetical protein
MIDLVEAQNYMATTLTLPSYGQTYVFGNIFYDNNAGPTLPIYYGDDQGITPIDRKGILYFYNNTVVIQMDQPVNYYVTLFDMSSTGDLDARNNIIYASSQTSGDSPAILDLLPTNGFAYFGTNWISSSYFATSTGWAGGTNSGNIAGLANIINNPQNDPGFVAVDSMNFNLTDTSQCLNEEGTLAANEPAILDEYPGTPRSTVLDLGALEL